MKPIRHESWANGSNNLAGKDRLPEGFARSLVNVDPTPGGKLELRAGFESVYSGTEVRGVLALGNKLLIADGTSLVELDTTTNSTRVLRSIAGAGPFVGDVLNDRLYFCTANQALEYDGTAVRAWGVQDVLSQPPIAAIDGGALQPGYYQIAATFIDAHGREGGTDRPAIIAITAGQALSVTLAEPPAGGKVRLYVSSPNGGTLYSQGDYSAGGVQVVGAMRDDTVRLGTALHRAPPVGHLVVAHNGVLAIAVAQTLWFTTPLRPHLADRVSGFLQYPVTLGAVVSAPPYLFVSADKSYAVAGLESSAPEQSVVLEFPAVPGTAVKLPDGRGAWMTRYGQAVSDEAGGMALVNRANFAPSVIARGAAGVIENNGNQLVVTSAHGHYQHNPLTRRPDPLS